MNKSAGPQPAPEPLSTNVTDDGAPVPGQLAKRAGEIAAQPPPQIEQVVNEPEPQIQPEKPAKPKLRVEKKPPKKVVTAEQPAAGQDDLGAGQNGGVEPLVLVPPAQTGADQAQTIAGSQAPIAQPDVAQPQPETAAGEQKSRSFFNFGSGKRKLTGKAAEKAMAQGNSGNWTNLPTPDAAGTPAADDASQQVAAVTPEAQPAPEPVQPPPASGATIGRRLYGAARLVPLGSRSHGRI